MANERYGFQKTQKQQAEPRLRQLLALMEASYSCNQIARLWNISPQRVQQLRVKALRLREQEKGERT